jgi:hypothetical protein
MSTTTDQPGQDIATPEPPGKNEKPWLWPTVAAGMAALTVTVTYLILRFASSPVGTAILAASILLTALTILGYLGSRRGHAAPFVAVALILPYLLGGAAAYASAHRVASEFSSVLGGEDFSAGLDEEPGAEEPVDEVATVDENEDGLDDFSYAQTDCTTIGDPESDFQECLDNGGYDPMENHDEGAVVEGESLPDTTIDGASYTWGSGVTMKLKVTHKEPYGSTDDFCGDGTCGIARPDDMTWALKYEISVPKDGEPLDPMMGCPGELHIVNGNDDDSLGLVAGDYSSDPGGNIRPGATKSGVAEYYIKKKSLGERFYIESTCGDPNGEEAAYFEQVIK